MKAPSANQMAGLLPAALFVHQVEEYYAKFPLWFSNLLNAQLSDQDFVAINGLGLVAISILSFSYLFNKNSFILVALGSFVFTNGLVHVMISLVTLSYVPGTVTALLLFLPLGLLVLRQLLSQLSENQRIVAVASGVVVLICVSLIAMNV